MDFFHEIQIGQAGERAEGHSPVHIAGNHVQTMSANHPIPPPYHDQIQGEGYRRHMCAATQLRMWFHGLTLPVFYRPPQVDT